MRVRSQRRGDESGSALIIALFFAVIFSLLVVSVITFADVGFKASAAFQNQGKTAYSAGGAVDAAINRFAGANTCGNYAAPAINGQAVVVHCDDLKFAAGDLSTTPANALLSLGTDPAEGIGSTGAGLQVQGNVFSNSVVNPPSASQSMAVAGDVWGLKDTRATPCPGVTQPLLPAPQAPYAKNCNLNGTANSGQGADPQLTSPTIAVPPRQTVPGCPASPAWLVTLHPGYYDDAGALSGLTNGSQPACRNAVVWMQPGVYYFDFTFRLPVGAPVAAGLWTINDKSVNVVGGTPLGWDPAAAGRPALTDPGGCDSSAVSGVQIAVGGASHLKVDTGGKVELCAPANLTDQRVALIGLPPANAINTDAVHASRPTALSNVLGFTNTSNALVIGEQPTALTADASLGSVTGRTPHVAVSGFSPNVPDGAIISKADLVVAHQDDDSASPGKLSISATVPFPGNTCGSGTSSDGVHPLNLQPGGPPIGQDTIHLTPCGLTSPGQLTGLAVTYAATLANDGVSATDALDGVTLLVTYRTPVTFRPTTPTASPGFVNPTNALEIGEQPGPLTADAALAAGATTTAALTLAGFGDPPIPPHSTIKAAFLRVAHHDVGGTNTPTVTVPFAGGSCNAVPLKIQPAAIADDRVDLTKCGLNDASQLAGLTATYNVGLAAGGSATDSVDGMWLEVTYDPPALTRPASSATSTATATSAAFTNPDNADAMGGGTSDASLDAVLTSASIDLSGYDLPMVPPGSVIDTASLRIAHQDVGQIGSVSVTLSPFGAAPCTPTATATTGLHLHPAGITEDTIDLKAALGPGGGCSLTDPAQLTGLHVSYTASLVAGGTSGTEHLDGIVLNLAFRPPTIHPPTSAASTASATTAAFSNANDALAIGEQPVPLTADATLNSTTPNASIQLGGFGTIQLPPGAVMDKAVLIIAHQDDDTTSPAQPGSMTPIPAVDVTFTNSSCDGSDANHQAPVLATHSGSIGFDAIDLTTSCHLTSLSNLTGLAVTYRAGVAPTDPGTAADKLDGVALGIVYRVPLLEPVSGCLTVVPYSQAANSNTCALVSSGAGTSSDPTRFVVNGTVYAPTAALDISMREVSSEVLTRGLVARTILLGITPASGYTRPIAGVPPEPVLFSAYPAETRAPDPLTPPTGGGFANPDNAQSVNGSSATAHLDMASTSSASLTLGGFDKSPPPLAPPVPITNAVLRVVHQDDGASNGGLTIKVSVAFAGSNSSCDDIHGPAPALTLRPGKLSEDQIDLTAACGLHNTSQLAGLTVTYSAAIANGTATDQLDGIEIVDAVAGPVLRASVAFGKSRAPTINEWSVLR